MQQEVVRKFGDRPSEAAHQTALLSRPFTLCQAAGAVFRGKHKKRSNFISLGAYRLRHFLVKHNLVKEKKPRFPTRLSMYFSSRHSTESCLTRPTMYGTPVAIIVPLWHIFSANHRGVT
jgi:hypothetical protein